MQTDIVSLNTVNSMNIHRTENKDHKFKSNSAESLSNVNLKHSNAKMKIIDFCKKNEFNIAL